MSKPWSDEVRAKALEMYAAGKGPAAVRRELGVAPTTLKRWAREAGKAPDRSDRAVKKANAERKARVEQSRQELSELLIGKLSRPAAELIMRRLVESLEAEELVTAARDRYTEAVRFERQIRQDYGPRSDEVRSAGAHRREMATELELAKDLRLDVRDLVGIVTRGVADHLSLEGIDTEAIAGDLIVELAVPRPNAAKSDAEAIPQSELAKVLELRERGA